MGVDLLQHNQEAFQEINKMIESGTKRIAVPRATGSGKTYLMGALAEKYNNDKKLVLEPTRPLVKSIKEKFEEFGIENTDFMTYQKLIRMSDEDIAAMDYKLIFLDECHHGTAPIWGQKTNYLMETHSDSIIFGTSATIVRNDGVNVVETLFQGNAIGELPLSTAIARNVLPCPHYITAIYRLDDEFEKLKKRIEASTNTKEEKHEFYEKMKAMQSHFEKSYGIPTILNKYIKEKNGRYLVFCKNTKHLDAMRDVVIDWFRTSGIKNVHSYAVYSKYPDKEKDYKEFCEDKSDSAKILFSINMLNEGLHIKNISGVLMLRTTQSNLIYLQQLGRLVDADNIGKYLLVFDFVNNFSSVNDGIGLLREIKDAVAREKESDPNFDDSGFEDIDTFFVLEQVVQIKEMFAEIEGRLIGREWTEEENSILREYYPVEGTKVADRLIGRTKVAVQAQASKLGLKFSNPWTNDEIEILRQNFLKIGAKGIVKQNLLPKHNYSSINGKAYKLGLIQERRRYIPNNNDDKIIIENYSKYGKRVMELLPHMTDNQIKHRAKQLGLKFDNKPWSKQEYMILNEDYGVLPIKELMKKLPNRSKKSIISKACSRGLTSDRSVDWKKEEDEKLYLLYPEHGSKMFSQLPNKTNSQIFKRLKQLGIKKEDSFKTKMKLIQSALLEGVVLSKNNQFYKGVNLYEWKVYNRKKFTTKELEIVNKVIPNRKLNLAIKVVDIKTKHTDIYLSKRDASNTICNKYESVKKGGIMDAMERRLSGKVTTPYKGQFMFYYATDEEVKKYLEDNKAG